MEKLITNLEKNGLKIAPNKYNINTVVKIKNSGNSGNDSIFIQQCGPFIRLVIFDDNMRHPSNPDYNDYSTM